ncbi:hypothetical protein [Pseudomonas oryzihabitans]|uniref:hypothetical protein n=1 Tax=Pseudomonas oryzihabitans TaxID=47885 RepID=UPI002B1DDE48|nr:hypothetical protein [Pseudomonas oryzihabitans]
MLTATTYTTADTFKKDFTFRVATESLKFDADEFQALVSDATAIYNNDQLVFKKVLLSAPTLAFFAAAAATLAADGFVVLQNEKAYSSSFGHYAIRFVKSHSLQNEDKQWIKDQVQELYLARIDANVSSYKATLKAHMVAEEKAKEAAKASEAEAKRLAKLEAEAEKKFQALLQEQGVA